MTSDNLARLSFVTCASNSEVLAQRLLASPCLRSGGWPLAVYFNTTSAAQGFNAAMTGIQGTADVATWLLWVHQDVFLPGDWDRRFCLALDSAVQKFPRLAVAGVYGLAGSGAAARRVGHVLDRGKLLREGTPMPCLVDSLDELLFAVRVGSGLKLDPALSFDFYATDLVLQAQQQGWQCAVVDACCEHWSDTPASGAVAPAVVQRIKQSAQVFERKWEAKLPISTPCFEIHKAGDVAAFIDAIVAPSP